MAKLSFSFETTTDEKPEMLALLNFMMAITDTKGDNTPTKRKQPKKTEPEPEVTEYVNTEVMEDVKTEPEPEVIEDVKIEVVEDVKTEVVELTEQDKKDLKNARRRERYAQAQSEKETPDLKTDPVKLEPVLTKIEKQNVVREEMARHADAHRESIRAFLVKNGIKGISTMTEPQLDTVMEYLKTLS